MRAIDLYAGIGGWSLGLKLAGIEVVQSYEWWQPALATHNGNHGTELEAVDIRKLAMESLPSDIDIVVGSPPCTQFSYSNRGGSGDIADGLVDLQMFFKVVQHLKPRYWAMENVPRVEKVLQQGFSDPDHVLYEFRDLKPQFRVVDFSEYGCPQARRRLIATNLSFERLEAFSGACNPRTLGDVISSLDSEGWVRDPVWGVHLQSSQVTERETEAPLSTEELRLNRDAKTYHPVYNNMSFPDRMDVPARTVTATCTRVSRESIVIEDPRAPGAFRRLSIRERASLQGFPITYQFFGKSFAEKAKMIGNSIPPTFTYLLGLTFRGKEAACFEGHDGVAAKLELPKKQPPITQPDDVGRSYPINRRFRAAIPHLRFKSGMRFEFANHFEGDSLSWDVRFYTGDSKNIQTHMLDRELRDRINAHRDLAPIYSRTTELADELYDLISPYSPFDLQAVWTRKTQGHSPFEIVDGIGNVADLVHSILLEELDEVELEELALELAHNPSFGKRNEAKMRANASRIVSGLIVGAWLNEKIMSTCHAQAA
jgi:DNA (cytosine-5)-methyltransferase 1